MTDRAVKTEHDRTLLLRFIEQHELPFTVTITKGRRRSSYQNRLQRQWCNEIAAQLADSTPEYVRGFLKLQFGVPILRAENEAFCEKYDRHVKPLTYETKLAFMQEPLDFPITRLMTVEQKTRYLNDVYTHFTEKGVLLTQPEEPGKAA